MPGNVHDVITQLMQADQISW